jgi:hypothetical protein
LGHETWKLFLLPVLEFLEFASQVIRYALIFVSAFFRGADYAKVAFGLSSCKGILR